MSATRFVVTRVVSACFGIALASLLSQAETYTGNCGFFPGRGHVMYLIGAFTGFIVALLLSLNVAIPQDKHQHALCALSFVYLLLCHGIYNGVETSDWLLIEGGLVTAFAIEQTPLVRFFVARSLVAVVVAKLTQCDSSGLSFSSMPSDALNQPFPFTPVWHLSQ